MVTVVLPRALVAILPGAERRVEVAGASVADVIDALEERIPGIRNRLCDAGPVLRRHLNVFVDGAPANLDTPVASGATVHVIPAVSGGAGGVSRRMPRGQPRSWRSGWFDSVLSVTASAPNRRRSASSKSSPRMDRQPAPARPSRA